MKKTHKSKRHRLIPAAFLILEKGKGKSRKILLSRRFNTGHEDGNYSLPSGHVELCESYTETIIREAKEEIGVKVLKKDLKFAQASQTYFDSTDLTDTYINIYFLCNKWKGEIKNMEPNKCDELRWVDISNLPKNTIKYVKVVLKNILENNYFSEIKK